ncbi:MAG: hypothetical protein H8D97_01660, partial [Proteobacteria bacterium]|nr:hypothetical protein [Pseudomonadota bacterium]
KKFASRFIEFFNLNERLRNLVFNSLKYGDAYIEYIKLDDIKVDFPKIKEEEAKRLLGQVDTPTDINNNSALVTEEMNLATIQEFVKQKYSSSKNNGKFILDELQIDKLTNMIFEFDDIDLGRRQQDDLVFEYSGSKNNKVKTKTNKKKDEGTASKLGGVILRYHSPHRIVPIVSNYDNVLGYIEVRSIEKKGTPTFNPILGFVDIIKKVSNLNSSNSASSDPGKYNSTIKLFATTISKKILAKYKVFYDSTKETSSNKQELEAAYQKQINSVLNEELYQSLKRMLLDTEVNNLFYKKLNVRFIPVDRIYKFPISNSSFYPFGESIIDPLVYPAKLYLLTQLSNIVTKLSRSSINFSAFV